MKFNIQQDMEWDSPRLSIGGFASDTDKSKSNFVFVMTLLDFKKLENEIVWYKKKYGVK